MHIDSDQLYSFAEATKLIPSSHGGHIGIATIHRWKDKGYISAYRRQVGSRFHWFVYGREILRMQGEPYELPQPEAKRGVSTSAEEAMRVCEELLGRRAL